MSIQLPVPAMPPALTPARRAAFLENLTLYGNVRLACRAASLSPQTAYRARQAEPFFTEQWDTALITARTHVEAVLGDRAVSGVVEKVFYHGEEVATRTRYDSRLLLAHLARLDRLAERVEKKREEEERKARSVGAEQQGRTTSDPNQNRSDSSPYPTRGNNGPYQTRAEGECKADWPPAAMRSSGRMSEDIASADALAEQQKTADQYFSADEALHPIPELERRLLAMEAARPLNALRVCDFDDPGEAEAAQLLGYEAGMEEWWAVARPADLPDWAVGPARENPARENPVIEESDQSGGE